VDVTYRDLLRLLASAPEIAQSYENLLTSLELLSSGRPLKSLLVTGTQPEDGTTTVAVNLALTAALAGKKVLVLDANFRTPQLHRIFQVENQRGLADILTSGALSQEVTQTVSLSVAEDGPQGFLTVVTSGGTASASVLTAIRTPEFAKALQTLVADYDLALVDTSPVLTAGDTLLFAAAVDGAILVLNAGTTAELDAALAKERLRQAGGNVLGVVLNRFDEKSHGSSLYPYSASTSALPRDAQARLAGDGRPNPQRRLLNRRTTNEA
jgi:capsular exopolysaccharide synthesis family protein